MKSQLNLKGSILTNAKNKVYYYLHNLIDTVPACGRLLETMRPIYVRPQDKANEERVMKLLVDRLNRDAVQFKMGASYTYRMAPDMACYDAMLIKDGKDCGIVEIKGRSGAPRDDDWHIAKRKIDDCRSEAARLNCKFFLVFTWDGKPFFCDTAKLSAVLDTHVSGRYDRGDRADEETMYLIPNHNFRAF